LARVILQQKMDHWFDLLADDSGVKESQFIARPRTAGVKGVLQIHQ